ncbi:hypothetical protein GDO86_005230 [Hymenochirus boettgeri]|uniref:HMG box domain-containing protein n=1 Tax=Hymenochirus boettgeri TaxID=247094 RepID=A0A8T2J943_9PIPI|nr:hypothetical protein GDO86_005230 [Hymenochirus boettgeri]
MEAPFDGTEVTVVSEEVEGNYLSTKPPVKKKKYKNCAEQSDTIKKPRSAYLLYYYDIYLKVQQEVPHLPQSEINKKISESWKLLSVAEKSLYLERAKLEKEGLDSNIKSGSSTMVSDVPGFRKILPRTEYILIPKRSTDEGKNMDLSLTPSHGSGIISPLSAVQQNGVHKSLIVNPGKFCLSEQSVDSESLAEEGTSFSPVKVVQEVHSGAVFGSYSGTMGDKMSEDVVLDDTSFEMGETSPYQPANMVLEDNGEIAVARSDVPTGIPVVTVMSIQSATYTRRGRGCCTNPRCSFTYVTRHKPMKCPLCSVFLGGKWVPKLPVKPEPKDPCPVTKERSESTKENKEAVSQLLHISPPAQVEEWRVIVSDLKTSSNKKEKRNQESTKNTAEGNPTEKGTETLSAVEDIQMKSPIPSSMVKEVKCIPKYRPALLTSRPIRAILPAPSRTVRALSGECSASPLTALNTEIPTTIRTAGLKPSTLKQLGHSLVPQAVSQEITDLGLATQRGKGKCKNLLCNYVYTNRHKPKTCPKCGSNLKDKFENAPKIKECPVIVTTVLNVRKPLTQSQKDMQRLSTLQLLRKTVQIPENESDLAEAFTIIQELNSSCLVLSNARDGTVTIEQSSWAKFYEYSGEQCQLCGSPLFKGDKDSLAGLQDCWLLTVNQLQMVTVQVKECINARCLALHSFNDIFTGLFNVGNKLLVTLDILFSIRNQIKLGEDPRVFISNVLALIKEHSDFTSPELLDSVHDLLICGYWAFECLTVRDFNDMICGVCGVAPKVEIAQRNVENTLTLSNIEFTWPEFLTSNEVNLEDFWSTLENEVLEQAAFPSSIPISKLDASIIAPFFPPLMRGPVVFNSESYKNPEVQKVPGNGSALVKLLQEGSLKLDQLSLHSTEELQKILISCGIPFSETETKDSMCYSILALSEYVQNGTQFKQPPSHLTAGKVYKVCPHQVVCGSKYIVRGESPRDHVDLLASSRHWPPVYVVDMATQVALCADLCYPSLTQQMWGKNQGCFSNPSQPPKHVSCPELLDQHYSVDVMVNETSILHPVTKSASRKIVHSVAEQKGTCDPTSRHHSLTWCRELEPYSAIISAIGDSKTSNTRHNQINFDNATHYYLYNRLVDFLTSRDVVNRQIHDIVQSCQPGEVVIRDALYRLGVAQIKTESPSNEAGEEEQTKCV